MREVNKTSSKREKRIVTFSQFVSPRDTSVFYLPGITH